MYQAVYTTGIHVFWFQWEIYKKWSQNMLQRKSEAVAQVSRLREALCTTTREIAAAHLVLHPSLALKCQLT